MAKIRNFDHFGGCIPKFLPDKREIWQGELQPPKLSKFRILAINLCLRGDLFALLLRNSQLLYASIGSF